jgi:CheY-like chemotaxis protein
MGQSSMKTKKVLILDDIQAIVDIVSLCIRNRFKCEVFIETDSTKAIDRALEIRPDLIILDIIMPDKSGCEIAQELKDIPELTNTKYIFFSGMFNKEEADLYNRTHVNQIVVPKGEPSKILLNYVERMLK